MREDIISADHKGRRIVLKEIKAAGYYDEAGRFRLLRCVGKITPVKNAVMAAVNSDANKRVA